LTFPKNTFPQVGTPLRRISQDPEPEPRSTPQDQGPKDHSRTTSVRTRILAEDIATDQDWCRYLVQYPDEAVTFYNAGRPVVRRLVPTLYEINLDYLNHYNRYRRHLLTPNKVFMDLPTQSSVLSLPLYFNILFYRIRLRLLKLRQIDPSDRLDIDSPAQTVTHPGRVSRPPSEWWAAPPTNTDTPMPTFNNPVMDPDEEVLNTSRNILDDKEPKFSRQAISGPKANLWHSSIEAEMDVLQRSHTWDVVDRPTDRKIVDTQWVFKIKHLSDRSVDKFKARLVAKGLSQIQG
jgi:hypothetical protein